MYDFLNSKKVYAFYDDTSKEYPKEEPYNPSNFYPEYPFTQDCISKEDNKIYDAVRNLLYKLGMDSEHFNTAQWNPFKEIIKPGDKVVIKPNFVLDKNIGGGDIDSVITHPSIIRAVVDYVYIALKGNGKISIGDAPQADADFDNLLRITKIEEIRELYIKKKNFNIDIIDFRQLKFEYKNGVLTSESRILLDGDPLGYTIFNLGKDSEFSNVKALDKLYGADYDRSETIKHHSEGKHEYCIANTVINADVVISLPKMKTHRKGGVTLNLKNLVGINGNKNYLPHFKIGTAEDGGDEYPQLTEQQKSIVYSKRKLIDNLLVKPNFVKEKIYTFITKLYYILKPILFSKSDINRPEGGGSWYGNDTVWRMVVDLNKILIYGSTKGHIMDRPQRKFFSIIDGIIAGEGDGPLAPDAKVCGLIIGGENFLLTDLAAIKLMGFDPYKIPQYKHSIDLEKYRFANTIDKEIKIESNNEFHCFFNASQGWKGHIEKKQNY